MSGATMYAGIVHDFGDEIMKEQWE